MSGLTRLATNIYSKVVFTILSLFVSIMAMAQDTKSVDVNIGTKSGNGFMGSPWMWVVGIAVFILLLVALLRGGRKSDV